MVRRQQSGYNYPAVDVDRDKHVRNGSLLLASYWRLDNKANRQRHKKILHKTLPQCEMG